MFRFLHALESIDLIQVHTEEYPPEACPPETGYGAAPQCDGEEPERLSSSRPYVGEPEQAEADGTRIHGQGRHACPGWRSPRRRSAGCLETRSSRETRESGEPLKTLVLVKYAVERKLRVFRSVGNPIDMHMESSFRCIIWYQYMYKPYPRKHEALHKLTQCLISSSLRSYSQDARERILAENYSLTDTHWKNGRESIMLLIKNGKLLTMTGRNYEKGSVLIKDGKIVKVGEFDPGDEQAMEVIDAEGCWVLPGLVEAHCHIGINEEKKGFEGNDCNESTNPVTPWLRALDAVNPMDSAFHNALSSGITSVMVGPGSANVVGGQFVFMKTHGRCMDKMVVLEPAAMKIAFGENPKTTYEGMSKMPSTRMAIASLLREELFNARAYQVRKKRAVESGEDFEPDYRMECWLPVLNREIPLKAHVHRADDILTAIRIAREFDLKMTLDHCTEGHLIAEEIAESGFPAIVGPSVASRNKIEVQHMDFKTPGILHKAGVKVAITSDHPVSRIQYLPIYAGFAAKEGLGQEEALKAITINAAEICNVADRIGSLEEGKDADIAIFNGNPMETFTTVLYTIIDGKVVYQKENLNA